MSSPFALTGVKWVLEQQDNADVLQSLGWLISSFLGPDPNMSLRKSCLLGSTALLDWIWSSSCTSAADRPAGWSLTNYLRSDRHYERFEFAEASKVAARRGDLAVMRWLLEHSCAELPSAIDEATAQGHLKILQLLQDHADASSHSVEARKVASGDGADHSEMTQASVKRRDLGSALGCAVKKAIKRGHYAVVRWVYENGYCSECGVKAFVDAKVVCRAMNYGSTELADFMTLADDAAEKHKAYSLRAELVRPLLECCRDDECAARAIQGLAKIGRLDLMQEVAQLYAPTAHYDWSYHWQNALEYACERDDMVMIQWLMARPYWRGLQVTVQKSQMHKAFRKAAERGSITAMEYLHSQEFTGDDQDFYDLVGPIRNGHVDAVAWLLEHGWQVERRDACDLMCEAAKYGHVDIMQLLQDKLGKQVYDERHGGISSGQFGRRALTVAVEHGHLAVLQWIRANRPELDWKGCSAGAGFLDDLEVLQWLYENRLCQLARCNVAAAHGRLEIVRWILSVEPEHSTSGLLDDAVRSNNMELVQWLHENTDASSTTEAMDFATRYGNLAMLKWLHAHRPDGCTTNAIEYALGLTDTRVASWLVKHFPELLPRKITLCCQLDMLIFVRVHFPQLLQPEAFRQGTTTISGFNSCNVNAARDWLRENYGDQVSWSISWIDITY